MVLRSQMRPRPSRGPLRSTTTRGDRAAFATLYERHHQEIYRYCRSIVRHEDDARDALQSTFTKAFVALEREERDYELRPWLFRIAHNEAIDAIRARRETHDIEDVPEPQSDSLHEQAERRAELRELRTDLSSLPERQRSALVLRELSGLGHEEIAAVLGSTPRAVKQVIFEARSALHECREGRSMDCQPVRRAVSDGDRRVLRGRKVRAHLRGCDPCRSFEQALGQRPAQLALLAPPLPLAAGAALLGEILPGAQAAGAAGAAGASSGAAAAGSGTVAAAGGAAGTVAGGLGAKVALVVAVAVTGTGGAAAAVELTAVPSRSKPPAAVRAAAAPRPAATAPDGAAQAAAPGTDGVGVDAPAARSGGAAGSSGREGGAEDGEPEPGIRRTALDVAAPEGTDGATAPRASAPGQEGDAGGGPVSAPHAGSRPAPRPQASEPRRSAPSPAAGAPADPGSVSRPAPAPTAPAPVASPQPATAAPVATPVPERPAATAPAATPAPAPAPVSTPAPTRAPAPAPARKP